MGDASPPRLRDLHRALADPLRLRLYELLALRPQSAKELAERVQMRPDRLYHHLAQLEAAKLIEVTDYRRLSGGKVERVYAPAATEPAGENPTPAEVAVFLNAVLETTRADVNAAAASQEAGEDRRINLGRTVVKVNEQRLDQLRSGIEELLARIQDNPDEQGVWTTVLWVTIDRQDRRPVKDSTKPRKRSKGTE